MNMNDCISFELELDERYNVILNALKNFI